MTALVLAAGNGKRFAMAGYAQPKPLLPMADGRPLIGWIFEHLPTWPRVVVTRDCDVTQLRPWIDDAKVIALAHPTNGPLASARTACAWLDGELLIVYCDVLLDYRAFVQAARQSSAPHACVTFLSDDPRYGYWDGDRVVEKACVSDRAVSGVFYFRDASALCAGMTDCDAGAGIPSLLNAQTYCHDVGTVIDLGTPAAYEIFMGAQAWSR